MRGWLCAFLLWPCLATAGPRIAIVIDDLGYHRSRGEAVVELPVAVTCAIIPSAPHARHLSALALSRSREILIHMPMEGRPGAPLDAGGIALGMSQGDLVAQVQEALAALPGAVGLNNHMGSGVTANIDAMKWLMDALAERQLFFLDSRTTPDSVAEEVARQHGLATVGRDIFLDNDRDLSRINEQFNKLLHLARKRGHAVAIGHPYPETIAYLRQVLPLLEQAGVKVVPVSELVSPGAPRVSPDPGAIMPTAAAVRDQADDLPATVPDASSRFTARD